MSRSIYIDHAATSFPKAPGVAAAVSRFLTDEAGNPGRGGHRLSTAASRTIEIARVRVAELLGADPGRTLFGSGATFWINTLLKGMLGDGDRVVTSSLEHNAVMRPLRNLERTGNIQVAVVEGSAPDGVPTVGEMAAAVKAEPTRVVVLTHASNVSGSVLPVEAIAEAVAPVPVIVDGAQGAGSIPFRFDRSGLAAYTCSGHKGLLAPPGTGVLLVAPECEIEPLVLGGTGSRSDSTEMPELLPDRLEAGTPNGMGIAGLGEACRWLAKEGVNNIHERGNALVRRLADGLSGVKQVRLHGFSEEEPRTATLAFTVDGVDNGELATWLDRERGIMLRAGMHCAPAAHRRLGTFPDGTLRAGIGPFNDADDVDALIEAVTEAATGGMNGR